MPRTQILSISRKRSGTLFAVGFAVILAVTPLASAMGFGITNSGVNEAKSSGWTPAYGQFWIGKWSNGNWGYLENQLNLAKSTGVTPVIQWYYWGDSISPNCVKYGCDGLSKSTWWSMGDTLSKKVRSIMGDRPVIIVVETEFNKGGVQHWEDFDGMLADHINMLKRNAPNAKIALGFGSWGHENYHRFDRAMGASHYAGYQLMRGITKDSWDKYWNAVDAETVPTARALKNTFGKPIILHDVALASYKADSAQKKVVDDLNARKGTLQSHGVFGVVYRDLRDYSGACSCWYYGEAEKHFGLKTSSGGAKAAWWSWVNMAKGGSTSTPPSSTTDGGSTSGSGSVTFTPKTGNQWWIQVSVSGSVSSVDARINGGSWFSLDKQSYGWTKSKYVGGDSTVQFRAKQGDGSYAYSSTYRWSDGQVVSGGTSSGSTSTGTSSVNWNVKTGNNWWLQADTDPDAWWMQYRVNGGSWINMEKQSYGWTKSTHVPSGSQVEFKAKLPGHVWVTSGTYTW